MITTSDAIPWNTEELLPEDITTSEGTSSGTPASTTIDRITRFGEKMTPTTLTEILRDNNTAKAMDREATTDLDTLDERNTGLLTPELSIRGKITYPEIPGPQGSPTSAENTPDSPTRSDQRRQRPRYVPRSTATH
jgi:hypothetical protein